MSSFDNIDADQGGQLTDAALSELKLGRQPFSGAPADNQWYVDDTTDSQLDDIKTALIGGDDLLLILGPEGAGKTTLLTQLGSDSGQRLQCFSVRGSERFSTFNLFAGMLEAFKKKPPDDLKLMLDALIPCLQGMMEHNTLGAIVLDDAHLIPEPELTKLLSGMLYVNSSDETLLRVTLAAPTEFEENIPNLLPEGADLPYSSLDIEAFDKTRAREYLQYRLELAGSDAAFPFSDKEIADINDTALGRPGALHSVAAEQLNLRDENYVPELPPELAAGGSRFGGGKLLLGALALAMIVGGIFWTQPARDPGSTDRYKTVETKKIDSESSSEELQLLNETDIASNSNSNSTPSNSTPSNDNQASVSQNNGQNDAQATEQARQDEAKRLAEEAAAAKAAEQAEREAAEKKAAEEKLAAEKRAAEEKARADAEAAAKKAEEVKLAAEKAEAERQAAEALANNLESPNWVLTQDPALFTVQMSASTDRKSVEDFMRKNELDPPNSIFTFERSGTTWYALVHGLYPSIEAARVEIEKMPESARSNQPWIRGVGRIQQALKEQN